MKQLILLVILTLNLAINAQIDLKNQIKGTWSYIDENGKKQKLVINKNQWNSQSNKPSNDEKTDWVSFSLTGNYKFIRRKKIQIIYHDKPREQGFAKIIKLTDTELIIKMSKYRFFIKSNTYKYSKE